MTEPEKLVKTVSNGYTAAIENMCGTLDYTNSV